ncbi:MAG: hypothetical protein LQ352_008085 [Teloschistes flavicans]|nr:MAG: hypothetical protein LQ352_008085 [Teloschistes flavicans]
MTVIPKGPPGEQPSHPDLVKVHRIDGQYQSYPTSLVTLPAGSLFSPITGHFFIKHRTWPSVEAPNGTHIDLSSDLFYVNHSCAPSLEYDVNKMEVRVSKYEDLHKDDLLTFFYPSTEWHMVQPFECHCRKRSCLGTIRGARELGKAKLAGYWLNAHINERLEKQAKREVEEPDRQAMGKGLDNVEPGVLQMA